MKSLFNVLNIIQTFFFRAVHGKDKNYEATRLHFENLRKRYGNPIIILNLIKVSTLLWFCHCFWWIFFIQVKSYLRITCLQFTLYYSWKTREKRPREIILRREFDRAIKIINSGLPGEDHLRYLHWDLHKNSQRY